MPGSAARLAKKTPSALTAITRFHSSSSTSVRAQRRARDAGRADEDVEAAELALDAGHGGVQLGRAGDVAGDGDHRAELRGRGASTRARSRSRIATRPPPAWMRRALAAPMPLAPPVMRAMRPSKSVSVIAACIAAACPGRAVARPGGAASLSAWIRCSTTRSASGGRSSSPRPPAHRSPRSRWRPARGARLARRAARDAGDAAAPGRRRARRRPRAAGREPRARGRAGGAARRRGARRLHGAAARAARRRPSSRRSRQHLADVAAPRCAAFVREAAAVHGRARPAAERRVSEEPRSERFRVRAAAPLRRETLIRPDARARARRDERPGRPGAVARDRATASSASSTASRARSFDTLDRFIAAHGIDLAVAPEAMALEDAALARLLVDVDVPRARARAARPRPHAGQARARRRPARPGRDDVRAQAPARPARARQPGARDEPQGEPRAARRRRGRGGAARLRRDARRRSGVSRYAPLNAMALLVGSQTGRSGRDDAVRGRGAAQPAARDPGPRDLRRDALGLRHRQGLRRRRRHALVEGVPGLGLRQPRRQGALHLGHRLGGADGPQRGLLDARTSRRAASASCARAGRRACRTAPSRASR